MPVDSFDKSPHRGPVEQIAQRLVVDAKPINKPSPLGLFVGAANKEANVVGESASRVSALLRRRNPLMHLCCQVGCDLLEQMLWCVDVVIDGSSGHTGSLCEVANRDPIVPLFGEQPNGRIVNASLSLVQG